MIKLELSVEQINVILRCLSKHPFEEVVNLITDLKNQAEPQVASQNEGVSNVATEQKNIRGIKKS